MTERHDANGTKSTQASAPTFSKERPMSPKRSSRAFTFCLAFGGFGCTIVYPDEINPNLFNLRLIQFERQFKSSFEDNFQNRQAMGDPVLGSLPLFIKEELECTICKEISLSPIQNCPNGDIVCGICFETHIYCPQCQGQLVPCHLAERVVKKYNVQFPCWNKGSGCQMIIRSWEMKEHLTVCACRPIKCFEKKGVKCDVICNLKDFVNHLIDVHDCECLEGDDEGSMKTITRQNRKLPSTYKNSLLPVIVLKFDGKIFLLHEAQHESLVCHWITIIGGADDAHTYKYEMTLSSLKKASLTNTFTCSLHVLPIHSYEFKNAKKSGQVGSILWGALEAICTEDVDIETGERDKYCCEIKIKFHKIGTDNGRRDGVMVVDRCTGT